MTVNSLVQKAKEGDKINMELLDRLKSRFPEHYRHRNILMIHGDCMDLMEDGTPIGIPE